ncbi:MAG: sigma-70 family RNA polymerase sigma factor [Planctomycetota bacterium]
MDIALDRSAAASLGHEEAGSKDAQSPGARSPVTDQERGGPSLAEQVWREHRRWVAAILLAHKPRDADLDDLLQAVATSVVRKIEDVRDRGAIKPWLRTVAINEARLAGRKRVLKHRGLRLVTEREAVDGGGVSREHATDGAEVSDRACRVMALANQLPESYREPVLLRCARGMSYRQISEITGLPETTIETRIARGRRMLRELVERAESEKCDSGGAG